MDDRIRASDADRDRIAARLREHFAEGRLTQDELEERLSIALSAKTLGDLRAVMTDLPEPGQMPGPMPGQVPGQTPASMGYGRWPTAQPGSYPPGRYRRRGPRLLPLLVIGIFIVATAAGHGGAAVAASLFGVLSTVAFIGLLLFVVGRIFRSAGRDWDHDRNRRGHHHHHHQRGYGPDDPWHRW